MFKINVEIKCINSRLTEALFELVAGLQAIKVTKVSEEDMF